MSPIRSTSVTARWIGLARADRAAAGGSRATGTLGTVRLTEFQELLHTEFGVARGDLLLADHVLPAMNGRTGAQAIEDGIDPREVWRALCAEFDVPKNRW